MSTSLLNMPAGSVHEWANTSGDPNIELVRSSIRASAGGEPLPKTGIVRGDNGELSGGLTSRLASKRGSCPVKVRCGDRRGETKGERGEVRPLAVSARRCSFRMRSWKQVWVPAYPRGGRDMELYHASQAWSPRESVPQGFVRNLEIRTEVDLTLTIFYRNS